MANIQESAQQLKQALDRIMSARENPEEVKKLVEEAKQKIDQFVQQSQQGAAAAVPPRQR
jgi:methyl-accepting chemotaxis protein